MASKKKKSKKARGRTKKELLSLSASQLRSRALSEMENGRHRDALDLLRHCAKTYGDDPETRRLIFRASLYRSAGLREKGMILEADAMAAAVDDYIRAHWDWTGENRKKPARRTENASEDWSGDLSLYIALRPGPAPFRAAAAHPAFGEKEAPSAPALESALVNRLLEKREWDFLDCFDKNLPLCRDAETVRAALPFMDDGDWSAALPVLRTLPRKSPFASLRLFCRAMASFYREEDEDAIKALSLIPESFLLHAVARDLSHALSLPVGSKGREAVSSRLPMFRHTGIPGISSDLETLADDIRNKQSRPVINRIKKIRKGLAAREKVLFNALMQETMLFAISDGPLDDGSIFPDCMTALFSPTLVDRMMKILYLRHSELHPAAVAHLIRKVLPAIFPDKTDLSFATAASLLHTVRQIKTGKQFHYRAMHSCPHPPDYKILGIPVRRGALPDPDRALLWMCAEAARQTPGDREPYELAASLPRISREASQVAEKIMICMKEQFPGDPIPCLDLAALYYERNAFRKAETELNEARRRAPHDQTVLDRYTISLLYSARKNMERGRFHLVQPDLDRAAGKESGRTAVHVREKQILNRLVDPKMPLMTYRGKGSQLSLFSNKPEESFGPWIDDRIAPFSLIARIRLISFLLLDMECFPPGSHKKTIKELNRYLKELVREARTLSSLDVTALFAPLGKEYHGVYPEDSPLKPLRRYTGQFLAMVDTADIFPVYERLMGEMLWKSLASDMRKRLKEVSGALHRKLKFYLEIVQCAGRGSHNLRALDRLTESIDDEGEIHELRQASHRLAPLFSGILGPALANFRFSGPVLPPFPGFFEDDEDLFDKPNPPEQLIKEVLEMAGNDPEILISLLKEIVDTLEINTYTPRYLAAHRARLIREIPFLGILLDFAKDLSPVYRRRLPREIRILMNTN